MLCYLITNFQYCDNNYICLMLDKRISSYILESGSRSQLQAQATRQHYKRPCKCRYLITVFWRLCVGSVMSSICDFICLFACFCSKEKMA